MVERLPHHPTDWTGRKEGRGLQGYEFGTGGSESRKHQNGQCESDLREGGEGKGEVVGSSEPFPQKQMSPPSPWLGHGRA